MVVLFHGSFDFYMMALLFFLVCFAFFFIELGGSAPYNCTTTIVMATEIDYVTLLLCVDMFLLQI
jgi:hypothetical protein